MTKTKTLTQLMTKPNGFLARSNPFDKQGNEKQINLFYTYGESIGEGGWGKVFVGKKYRQISDTNIYEYRKAVAIKMVFLKGMPLAEERMKNEYNMLYQAGHLGVTPYVIKDEVAYIPMNLLPGEDLIDILSDRKFLKEDENVIRMIYNCSLAHNHNNVDRDIIHGDVKPDNIRMNKITFETCNYDYGFAVSIRRTNLNLNFVQEGTPEWRAPEIKTNLPFYDPKTDIFSLGQTFSAIAGDEGAWCYTNEKLLQKWCIKNNIDYLQLIDKANDYVARQENGIFSSAISQFLIANKLEHYNNKTVIKALYPIVKQIITPDTQSAGIKQLKEQYPALMRFAIHPPSFANLYQDLKNHHFMDFLRTVISQYRRSYAVQSLENNVKKKWLIPLLGNMLNIDTEQRIDAKEELRQFKTLVKEQFPAIYDTLAFYWKEAIIVLKNTDQFTTAEIDMLIETLIPIYEQLQRVENKKCKEKIIQGVNGLLIALALEGKFTPDEMNDHISQLSPGKQSSDLLIVNAGFFSESSKRSSPEMQRALDAMVAILKCSFTEPHPNGCDYS